jgi:hypothetical protein
LQEGIEESRGGRPVKKEFMVEEGQAAPFFFKEGYSLIYAQSKIHVGFPLLFGLPDQGMEEKV